MRVLVSKFSIRGEHFDEEAYRNIFQKLQDENYFDFHIEYRRFSDH